MTSTKHISDFQLPNVIPVNVGVICIPSRPYVDSLSEFEQFNREVTHLLALLPDEDKAEAQFDDDYEFIIHTTSVPALKYACNSYLLSDSLTTCHAVAELVAEHFDGEVCDDCVDNFIDEALDAEYTSVVVESGVVLKKGVL
jgi:hypothetical protein